MLTVLHAGGKFGDNDSGYFHSGGLHGVGASVVNALSKKLVATVSATASSTSRSTPRASPQGKVEKIGPFRGHGTAIYFEPDETIFKTTRFDADTIKARLEDMSYIHSGLKITFKNEHGGRDARTGQPRRAARRSSPSSSTDGEKPAVTEAPFTAPRDNGEQDRGRPAVDRIDRRERIRSYVNGIRTPNGGTHENGLKAALRKAVNNYIETHDIKIKGLKITAEDIREGVVAVLSVFVREPQFEGQTKERLNNPEMDAAVDNFVRPALEAWLNNNKTAADAIIGRIVLAAKAREASRAAVNEVKRKSPGSRRLEPAGQARRLQVDRPRRDRTLHRRGRFGRRLGEAGPQQQHAGRAAASRQDPQRRGPAHREGARESGTRRPGQRTRHRRRR